LWKSDKHSYQLQLKEVRRAAERDRCDGGRFRGNLEMYWRAKSPKIILESEIAKNAYVHRDL
jgi:hypothetical protein